MKLRIPPAGIAVFTLLLGGALGVFLAAPPQSGPQRDAAHPEAAGHLHGAAAPKPAAGEADPHEGHAHEAAAAPATQWTCSMHPQIKLPEKGLCPICNMDLIPLESGGGVGGLGAVMSKEAVAMARIATTAVVRESAAVQLRLVGKVTYDETRVARLTAWFGGRIERLFVDFTGTVVKKGDHMLALYSPELLVAQQELIQAARERRAGGAMKVAADATYAASRDKLRLWGLQGWQIRAIEQRSRPMETVTIFAPMGGVVTHKDALEGGWVKQGTSVYTIADLTHVWVELDAYESDIAWLRYGQKVDIHVDAFPGQPFQGAIAFVNPVMDDKTRTIKVRVHLDNPDLRLKPGMFVRAVAKVPVGGGGGHVAQDMKGKYVCPMHPEVVADSADRCRICGMRLVAAGTHWLVGPAMQGAATEAPLVIPHTAPLITGKRVVVFVEKQGAAEPTYLVREITLGPRAGDKYVVVEGLMEGEQVVTQGAFRLDSAMQIVGEPSIMNHEGDTEADKRKKATERKAQAVLAHLEQVTMALKNKDHAQARQGATALVKAVAEVEGARGLAESAALLQRGADVAAMQAALPLVIALARKHIPAAEGLEGAGSLTPQGGDQAFAAQLGEAVQATLAVGGALAADDADKTRAAAKDLLAAVRKLAAGKRAVDPLLLRSAEALTAADADIAAQRSGFEGVNLVLIPLLALYGDAVDVPYDQVFCPMAFDGKGAPWLQGRGEVANPYFGASMLRCGGVVYSAEKAGGGGGEKAPGEGEDPHAGHGGH